MSKRTATWAFVAVSATLPLGGCFTAINRAGAAWGGGGSRTEAAVADAVTLPLQAPVLLIAGAGAVNRSLERAALARRTVDETGARVAGAKAEGGMIHKAGHYPARISDLPRNENQPVVLPRVLNPIALFANLTYDPSGASSRSLSFSAQMQNTWLGYDFEAADYLRTRVKLDDKGNVVSANSAKIMGDFRIMATGLLSFTYYFNPTPNDRNLEFAPKKNLFPANFPGANVNDP